MTLFDPPAPFVQRRGKSLGAWSIIALGSSSIAGRRTARHGATPAARSRFSAVLQRGARGCGQDVSVVAATGLTGSLRGEFDDLADVDWLPIPRQQRDELMSLGSPGHDALQNVGEPSHRIDAVHLRGLDQGHRNRPMTRSAVAARKERILSRQCMRPDGAFDRVRVHFDAAVVERDQAGPVAYGVAYGLGCVSASASRTRQGVAAQASAGGRTAGSETSDARHWRRACEGCRCSRPSAIGKANLRKQTRTGQSRIRGRRSSD